MTLALRMSLSGALLALTFWLSSTKLAWHDLASVDAASMAACLVLSLLIVLILAWRWRYLVAHTTAATNVPSMSDFMAFSWAGLAVNQLVPSVVGGDALRVTLLARRGLQTAAAATSVIVDRLYGLVGLLVLCIASAPFLSPELFVPTLAASAVLALGIAAAARIGRSVLHRFPLFLSTFAAATRTMSWSSMLLLVAAAVAAHLANIGIFLVIAHAVGASVPFVPTVAIFSAVLLLSVLPFSLAGWGLRELALLSAFPQIGHASDGVVLASVVYGVFLLVTQTAGFLMILRSRRP
jgi:uncharacterized membrane protein YbhN (UPF0104 family)